MDITKLLGRQEDLDPELQEHLYTDSRFGDTIKHPLVFSIIHTPHLNALVNAQLRAKKAALQEAWNDLNYSQVIWLHERPYRLDALRAVQQDMDPLRHGRVFWELAGQVWVDSENIFQNIDEWRDVFESAMSYREYFMSEQDRETMLLPVNKGGMDRVVTVYRGFCADDAVDGMSWTLSPETAAWFARRAVWRGHGDVAQVAKGTLSKRDVIALMTGRGELEVVAFPENVMGIEVEVLGE